MCLHCNCLLASVRRGVARYQYYCCTESVQMHVQGRVRVAHTEAFRRVIAPMWLQELLALQSSDLATEQTGAAEAGHTAAAPAAADADVSEVAPAAADASASGSTPAIAGAGAPGIAAAATDTDASRSGPKRKRSRKEDDARRAHEKARVLELLADSRMQAGLFEAVETTARSAKRSSDKHHQQPAKPFVHFVLPGGTRAAVARQTLLPRWIEAGFTEEDFSLVQGRSGRTFRCKQCAL